MNVYTVYLINTDAKGKVTSYLGATAYVNYSDARKEFSYLRDDFISDLESKTETPFRHQTEYVVYYNEHDYFYAEKEEDYTTVTIGVHRFELYDRPNN
jgi:hypothetical protein